MERTLKLRAFQLKGITMVGLVGMGIISILGIFLGIAYSDNLITQFSIPHILINFLEMFMGFFVITVPLSDGMSDFDSATRFGISRLNYFLFNIVFFIVIGFIDVYVDNLNQLINQNDFSIAVFGDAFAKLNLSSLIMGIISIFFIAIIGYGIYRFGWKFMLGLAVIPGVITIFVPFIITNMLSNDIAYYLVKYEAILQFFNQYKAVIFGLVLLLLMAIYYWLIKTTETK